MTAHPSRAGAGGKSVFYASVCDWRFEAYGPPNFFLINTANKEDPGIKGALQSRRCCPVEKEVIGYEGTIRDADVDAIAPAVKAHGGTVVMPKAAIPGVGWLIKSVDPEGNLACAARYDPKAE